jgi:hypothetical protein
MNSENRTDIGFIASTGRTATSLIAKLLARLNGVTALHEGHYLQDKKSPIIPPINMEQRRCWHDTGFSSSLVKSKRSPEVIQAVMSETGNAHFVDVAYYNASIIRELYELHANARILIIFRRCEPFVRSATTISGEDKMPVGWPARGKDLTPREKFIELGRLKPKKGSEEAKVWDDWSAIEKNIWLWCVTNQYMWDFFREVNDRRVHFLHYELLEENPEEFWRSLLGSMNLLSEENLAICIAESKQRENAKMGGYQIGESAGWTRMEREALCKALVLEGQIYE